MAPTCCSPTDTSIGWSARRLKRRWRGRVRSIQNFRSYRNRNREANMSSKISRRQAIRVVAGATVAAAAGSMPRVLAQEKKMAPDKQIRLGIIGVGARGSGLLNLILRQDPNVQVPALCDIDEQNLNRALDAVEKSRGKKPEGYSKGEEDYQRMLQRDDLDGVLIVTPHKWHAPMTIDALKAGKFVGAEVPAAVSVDECWQLVKTQQQTKT